MDKEKNKKIRILIVDDEPLIRESLFEILRIEGFKVQMAPTGEEALTLLSKTTMDIVVTDLKLPAMSGLDLLEKIRDDSPKTETILMTGYGSIETAVEAMKFGAFDYITKPINDHEIKIVIQKIVEKKEILDENESLRKLLADGSRNSFCGMIGSSPKMQHVYQTVEAVATTNATILITGESGTGKGMVARAIHESDQNRHKNPFVEVSCGALSETLLESELFGHVKGAFTGAIKDKEGRFEYANGGTIFLDEIDAFTPNLQVKLLKVLQDNVFERVGDNVTKKGDFRIVVATNQDLVDLVRTGDFREDLYYRINVISIVMPSLRDRLDDIELIAQYYVNKYSDVNNKSVREISPEVLSMFQKYNWPGNIRELENALEGAVIMAKTGVVQKTDIPSLDKFEGGTKSTVIPNGNGNFSDQGASLKSVVEQPEKGHIISVLKENHWNRNKAAAALGINRTTLYNKMKKYQIFDEE